MDEQLTERVIIPMTKSMVEEIGEYRFTHRHESRAEAVRELVRLGLEVAGKRKPKN